MTMTSRECVPRVPWSERDRWNEVLASLRPRLLWSLEVRGVDHELAEDLVQDTLAIIWRKLGSLRQPERLRSWATTIVLNRMRTYRARQRTAEEVPETIPVGQHPPLECLSRDEGRAWLARTIAELPPGHQQAVSLRVADGLRPDAVCEALGISRRSLRMRVRQGLKHLRMRGASLSGRRAAAAFGFPA